MGNAEYIQDDGSISYVSPDQAMELGLPTADMAPTEFNAPEPAPAAVTPPPITPAPAISLNEQMAFPQSSAEAAELQAAMRAGPASLVPPVATAAPAIGPSLGQIVDDPSTDNKPPTPLMAAAADNQVPSVGLGSDKIEEHTRTGKDISPDVIKKMNAADAAQLDAAKAGADAANAKSVLEGQEAIKRAAEVAQFNEAEALRQQAEQAAINKRQAKLDAMGADYAGMKIDSNNYWADKSTGDKIMAGLAIGLGGYGGRPNIALENLNKAIERDIDIQKANIDKAGNSLTQQKGMFSDFLKKTGNEQEARLKTHGMALEALKAQTEALMASTNNDLVKANGQMQLANISQAQVANRVALADTIGFNVKMAPAKEAAREVVPNSIISKLDDAAGKVDVWVNLENTFNSIDTDDMSKYAGPIDDEINRMYDSMGWEVPNDLSALRAETEIARFKFVKAMTGAGVNVAELNQYQKILPSLKKNPKTMLAIVQKLRTDATRDLKNLAGNNMRANPVYTQGITEGYSHYWAPQVNVAEKFGIKTH